MYGRVCTSARFLAIAMLAPLVAACTTTVPSTTTSGKTEAPVSAPTLSLPRFTPISTVDPAIAEACVISAANKYFLPVRVIRAVNSRPAGGGGTIVDLQVDLRTAVCQVSANGTVRSVVDTSPKSADQAAADAAAAKTAAAAPKAAKKK